MNSQFQYLVDAVRKLPPGHRMAVDRMLFYGNYPPPFTGPDWVLEQIVGSAYEYSWWYGAENKSNVVYFQRRKQPLSDIRFRTYVSPDRMQYVDQIGPSLYRLKSEPDAVLRQEEYQPSSTTGTSGTASADPG